MPEKTYKWSEESRKKLSKTKMGHTHGFKKGHVVTEEIREKIRKKQLGSLGNNWSGGIHLDCNGYRLIHRPDHPNANCENYVFEHRLVMEEHLGRYLIKGETIHHINKDVADNSIENLILFKSHSEHMIYHERLKKIKL